MSYMADFELINETHPLLKINEDGLAVSSFIDTGNTLRESEQRFFEHLSSINDERNRCEQELDIDGARRFEIQYDLECASESLRDLKHIGYNQDGSETYFGTGARESANYRIDFCQRYISYHDKTIQAGEHPSSQHEMLYQIVGDIQDNKHFEPTEHGLSRGIRGPSVYHYTSQNKENENSDPELLQRYSTFYKESIQRGETEDSRTEMFYKMLGDKLYDDNPELKADIRTEASSSIKEVSGDDSQENSRDPSQTAAGLRHSERLEALPKQNIPEGIKSQLLLRKQDLNSNQEHSTRESEKQNNTLKQA